MGMVHDRLEILSSILEEAYGTLEDLVIKQNFELFFLYILIHLNRMSNMRSY